MRDTPAVRTNALPIVSHPTACRLVDCTIGGWAEVHAAIDKAGVDIDAQRCRDGVLAFGSDADVRRAFEPYGIEAFGLRPIPPGRLAAETGERALLRDALFRALGKRPGLRVERRGRTHLLRPDPLSVQPSAFGTDAVRPVDRIAGCVKDTKVAWTEACGLRLDHRLGVLWLLLEPRVVLDVPEDVPGEQLELARAFVRERLARRRNREANAMLDGWIGLLAGAERGARLRLRAFGCGDGIDAEFEVLLVSGFSGAAR